MGYPVRIISWDLLVENYLQFAFGFEYCLQAWLSFGFMCEVVKWLGKREFLSISGVCSVCILDKVTVNIQITWDILLATVCEDVNLSSNN